MSEFISEFTYVGGPMHGEVCQLAGHVANFVIKPFKGEGTKVRNLRYKVDYYNQQLHYCVGQDDIWDMQEVDDRIAEHRWKYIHKGLL